VSARSAADLDGERIEMLASGIMGLVKANFLAGPRSNDRVYEALNALAACAGVVLEGTGWDAPAVEFYRRALEAPHVIDAELAEHMERHRAAVWQR
jgi:hypothetical protein